MVLRRGYAARARRHTQARATSRLAKGTAGPRGNHYFHLLLIERVLYDSVQIHMVQLGALCCSGSLQSYRVAVVILNIIKVPKLVGVLGNQLVLYL